MRIEINYEKKIRKKHKFVEFKHDTKQPMDH